MHEAILENSLSDYRSPLGLSHECHVLRLHVSRKMRIGLGDQVTRFQSARAAAHVQRALIDLFNLNADLAQFADDAITVFRITVPDFEFAVGDSAGHDERSGFDSIGNYLCWAAPRPSTPSIWIVGVPAPRTRAPILLSNSAKSRTSGSRAALLIVVRPRASVAAIIKFSVPVTEILSKWISAPTNPSC